MKLFTFALALALLSATASAAPARTDLLSAIRYQSSVKSQGPRNLCTVFATLGVIEALYLKDRPNLRDIDLSEEWVQYLVAVHSPSGGGNGSTVASNFQYI